MKVIKRDGRLQELDLEKIKISILCATNESKELLNESDVKILVEDINSKIKEVRKEGIEEGRKEEKIKIARNMKLSGLDTDTIANITNLSPDEIDKL